MMEKSQVYNECVSKFTDFFREKNCEALENTARRHVALRASTRERSQSRILASRGKSGSIASRERNSRRRRRRLIWEMPEERTSRKNRKNGVSRAADRSDARLACYFNARDDRLSIPRAAGRVAVIERTSHDFSRVARAEHRIVKKTP